MEATKVEHGHLGDAHAAPPRRQAPHLRLYQLRPLEHLPPRRPLLVRPLALALTTDCTSHPVLLDLSTLFLRPLTILTNTWCSSGTLLPNASFFKSDGFNDGDHTIHLFASITPTFDWTETSCYLSARRWYATNQLLPDCRKPNHHYRCTPLLGLTPEASHREEFLRSPLAAPFPSSTAAKARLRSPTPSPSDIARNPRLPSQFPLGKSLPSYYAVMVRFRFVLGLLTFATIEMIGDEFGEELVCRSEGVLLKEICG
ncbi:hypothetical protein J5N97_026348 [Dioscorea zingiberensis]|uniref:Glyoxal oxidase N-terminal domain-containing protein n=1 Tax=Dioscorea zingiberensis TaxID=325984 RepID=A0A9D5C285_9LILI|nr:hypothetical protein J5N97_026348 [Dioscorea zingiberensis]